MVYVFLFLFIFGFFFLLRLGRLYRSGLLVLCELPMVLVHDELVGHFYVRVDNNYNSAGALLDECVHLPVSSIGKQVFVKSEILAPIVVVDVHPQHV